MVEHTLRKMVAGGIYDQVAGGFARYSTDRTWTAPHFEKMLYDNSQLASLYMEAWQATSDPFYERIARETLDYVMREMTSPEGGFYSATDADSEGEEGKFYVWAEAEIDDVLGADAEAFKQAFDVTTQGNWEGKTILNRSHDLALATGPAEAALKTSREKLLAVRGKRIWPQRDDKVLADWNGLMIAALAKAGAIFGEDAWIDAAEDVFRFVVENMSADGGRLHHTWCAGEGRHPAVLDDYANMALAALLLHGVTGQADYLDRAQSWVQIADNHYWDVDNGGYFLGADDTGDVIARSKPVHDNAVPSGNGVMAEVLARLFYLTGEDRYRDRALALFRAIAARDPARMANQPTLLNAFELLEAAQQVVIIGERDDPATAKLRRAVFDAGLAGRIVVQLEPGADLPDGHPAKGKNRIDGKPTAYVCRGPVCGLPVTAAEDLAASLA